MFTSHHLDDEVLARFRRLCRQVPANCEVWLCYDDSQGDFDPGRLEAGERYLLFTHQMIAQRRGDWIHRPDGWVVLENYIFVLLHFQQQLPQYEYLWRVEYDVCFSGNWRLFFNAFVDNASDLLGTTLGRYSIRPQWRWWGSLRSPEGEVEAEKLIRGFFPFIRLSKRACDALVQAFQAGWGGHDEVVVPTVLRAYGLTLEDIGGKGEFVRAQNVNRFYTNEPAHQGLCPGTFVYRPVMRMAPDVPNLLWHPLKLDVLLE